MEPEKIKNDESFKIMSVVRKEIDSVTFEIFRSNHVQFLAEPSSYIVYSVWGVKKDGELTGEQKAISDKIEPLISNIKKILKLELLEYPRQCAIQYILRDLIIAKLVLMTEMFREKVKHGHGCESPSLKDVEPLGHA